MYNVKCVKIRIAFKGTSFFIGSLFFLNINRFWDAKDIVLPINYADGVFFMELPLDVTRDLPHQKFVKIIKERNKMVSRLSELDQHGHYLRI